MLDEYGDVTLAIDIMYINEMPFMLTTSQAIHFSTAEMMKNETKSTIIKLIQQIINTFQSRGFRVKQILRDQQFECSRNHMELQGINVNITGRDNHVQRTEGTLGR